MVAKDGSQYSYKEISSAIDTFLKFDSRSLVFCLAQNSLGSLVGYLAFIQNKIVPLMLDSDLNFELLDNLIITYSQNICGYQKK